MTEPSKQPAWTCTRCKREFEPTEGKPETFVAVHVRDWDYVSATMVREDWCIQCAVESGVLVVSP